MAAWLGAAGPALGVGDAADEIRGIAASYGRVGSLYFKASRACTVTFEPPPGTAAAPIRTASTYELWYRRPFYRVLFSTPDTPGMTQDVRYDGQKFQWHDVTNNSLAVSDDRDYRTPILSKDPSLAPLNFLVSTAPDTVGLNLNWAALVNDESVRGRLGRVRTTGPETAELTGEFFMRTPCRYVVTVRGSPPRIARVECFSADRPAGEPGGLLSRYEFDGYVDRPHKNGVLPLPTRVRGVEHMPNGWQYLDEEFELTQVVPDAAIDPGVFTFDHVMARSVVDLDRNQELIKSSRDVTSDVAAARDVVDGAPPGGPPPATVTVAPPRWRPVVLITAGVATLIAAAAWPAIRRRRSAGGGVPDDARA